MPTLFTQHLSLHTRLTDADIDAVAAAMEPLHLDKGQALLAPGEVWSAHAFVCSGCLRVFFAEDDGGERVLYFAPEGWWATDIESFQSGGPSVLAIDAVEPSDIQVIRKSTLDALCQTSPPVLRAVRALQAQTLVTIQRRVVNALHKTASQRYQDFAREYPGLDGRIPQYQIAAYVGISAEFLSTLRRRTATETRSTS